jgi:hypothetical protein
MWLTLHFEGAAEKLDEIAASHEPPSCRHAAYHIVG